MGSTTRTATAVIQGSQADMTKQAPIRVSASGRGWPKGLPLSYRRRQQGQVSGVGGLAEVLPRELDERGLAPREGDGAVPRLAGAGTPHHGAPEGSLSQVQRHSRSEERRVGKEC